MKRIICSDAILAMSNVRGKYIKNPHTLPFSFYFSSGAGVNHGPRVKPMFNEAKLKQSLTGTLELCNNWEFEPGKDDTHIPAKDVSAMKAFFRKYLVLFCAVWDEQMQDATLEDYFRGNITFSEMLTDLEFYEENSAALETIHTVEELEDFCRLHNLVNFYGN